MSETLLLQGERIYIREWKIQDAQQLSALAEQSKTENAEIRILDWSLRFSQTRLGTLPIFSRQNQLLGVISLQPRIRKDKATFQLKVSVQSDLENEAILEARQLMRGYAQQTLGITDLEE